MAALRVELACGHALWPTGDQCLYREGETAYCGTCRKHRRIVSVGRAAW